MNFRNKTITLMGLGIQGGAVEDALFFLKNGAKRLIITDLKKQEDLKSSTKRLGPYKNRITYHLGKHVKEDFIQTDLVIKNPGVPANSPFLKIAQKNGVAINTSLEIFFRNVNTRRVIGVTGTKGKSSTTALIYEVIKLIDKGAYCAGNIGVSPLKYLSRAENHWGVLELSSWQLEGLKNIKKSPHISVFTNIKEDHLNSYKNMQAYKEAKNNIFRYQKKQDILILNYEDTYLRTLANKTLSKPLFFSVNTRPLRYAGAYKKGKNFFVKNTKVGEWLPKKFYLNPSNIAAALTVASCLKIDPILAFKKIMKFRGLTGRLEHIATFKKTIIINDTTATNPFATINSLSFFKNKKIALIVGGENKKLHYDLLVNEFKNVPFIALLPGTASDTIKKEAQNLGFKHKLHAVNSLEEAVRWSLKKDPEVLLFSPAAASFNMFKNEFHRGEEFNKIIQKLSIHASKKRG